MAEKQPPGPPPGLDMQVTDVAVIIRAAPPDIAKVPTGDLLHELAVRTTNLRQAVYDLAGLVERHIRDVRCQCVTTCSPPCPRAELRDAVFKAKRT